MSTSATTRRHYLDGRPPHEKILTQYSTDQPEVHQVIAEMRGIIDEFENRVLIGEIYLPLQVLALFDANNQPIFVTHISTGGLNPDGTDATFCEDATYTTDIRGNPLAEPETKAICAESKTPPGVFRLKRYEDGQHVSPLGGMKNPWYFNYGIAIHGAQNVPDHPASHGCARVSNAAIDYMWGANDLPIGLEVWVY